jgi:Peptidase M10 serralysin C terminal/RTX calcium-binding nonapeptide repeat (4 copies)
MGVQALPAYPPILTDQQIANQISRDGVHWNLTTVTYSFNDQSTAGNALDAAFQSWVNIAIHTIGEMVGINFVQTTSGGAATINGSRGDGSYSQGTWNLPGKDLTSGTIFFDQSWDTNQSSNLSYGSFGLLTIMHELLHGLGLSHPGNYNATASYFPDASFRQDTTRYTVMSYFDADSDGSGTSHWFKSGGVWTWEYAQTPMVYDLLALTSGGFGGYFGGYSANLATRSGATVYGYHATAGINAVYNFASNAHPVLTIYDAGGIDTLDLSGDTVATARTLTYDNLGVSTPTDVARTTSVIDIRPGAYSSTHGMSNNIGIAFGTVIENVTGTNFNDTITGNDAANTLRGGLGNDAIYGGAGNDSIEGGAGADTLDGGDFETDTLNYSLSDAGVRINTGTNTAAGGHAAGDVISNFESVIGSAFNDILAASGFGSALTGNAGNDYLSGAFGTLLTGGPGADWFVLIDDQGGPGSIGSVADLSAGDYVYIGGTSAKPVFSTSGLNVKVGNYTLVGAAAANVTVITQAANTLLFDSNVTAINSVLTGGIAALSAIGAYSTHIFDANANESWRTIESAYTTANALDFTTTVFDAGQPYYALTSDFDQASDQNWSVINTYFSSAGVTDYYFISYDPGQLHSGVNSDLDQSGSQPWSLINTYYSAPSVVDYYYIAYDAGQPFFAVNSDIDQAGNQTWTKVDSYYSSLGVVDYTWALYDAGQPNYGINSDFDQTGSQTWSVIYSYYSAANVLDTTYIANDAGQAIFSIYSDYDQTFAQAWSVIDTYYSASSVVDYYYIKYDAGQAAFAVNSDLDQASNQTWTRLDTYYSDAGVVDYTFALYDAGQPYYGINSNFDQAGNQTWSVIYSYYTSASALDSTWIANDPGQAIYAIYTDYDQASNQTWTSVSTYYTVPSVVDYYYITYDAALVAHRHLLFRRRNCGQRHDLFRRRPAPLFALRRL